MPSGTTIRMKDKPPSGGYHTEKTVSAYLPETQLIGVRGCAPGTAYVIPARAGVWRVWCASWGRLGDSGLSLLPLSPLAGLAPCGSVSFEIRLRRRGIPGSGLLSEIYVLAFSEADLAPRNKKTLLFLPEVTRRSAATCNFWQKSRSVWREGAYRKMFS